MFSCLILNLIKIINKTQPYQFSVADIMLQFKLHKKLTIILSSLKYRYRGNAVVNSCEFIFLDLFIGLHNILLVYIIYGLPDGSDRKNLLAIQETWFNTWVGKIPWKREWQPTPIFLPGECYGQRSLAGYSPQGHIELDTTETTQHTHTYQLIYLLIILFQGNGRENQK